MYLSSKHLFLIYFLFLAPMLTKASLLDSLRIEKNNGQHFVVHRVDEGETLYGLSRKYKCSVDEIREYNESIQNGLKIFDELLIPIQYKPSKKKIKKKKKNKDVTTKPASYHVVKPGETLYSISRMYEINLDTLKTLNQLTNNAIGINDTLIFKKMTQEVIVSTTLEEKIDSIHFHVVQPKETLLSLTRKYSVSLDSLTKWNGLKDYTISIGQKLIVQNDLGTAKSGLLDTETLSKQKSSPDTIYVKTDESEFKTQEKEIDGKQYVIEEGFAMRIHDTSFTTKLLALHRTAPLGKVVRVKNRMNNQEIEVRVVGKLPNTALNKNVLLRLSDAAYQKLGGLDLKLPINSVYEK